MPPGPPEPHAPPTHLSCSGTPPRWQDGRGLQCCVRRVLAVVSGNRVTSYARRPGPAPGGRGRGQARGPRSRRRGRLTRLQVAALRSRPLRQLGSHSVLGSSLPFHVSRKSSRALAGPWQVRARLAQPGRSPGGLLRGRPRSPQVQPLRSPQVRRWRGPGGQDRSAWGVHGLRRGGGVPSAESLVPAGWRWPE